MNGRDPKYEQARLEVADGVQILDEPELGSSRLARPELRARQAAVRPAPGEVRDLRQVVPDATRFAARRGSATEVYLGSADRLRRQASQ
jgi:hypothetical protein